jgi:hypothetical protein
MYQLHPEFEQLQYSDNYPLRYSFSDPEEPKTAKDSKAVVEAAVASIQLLNLSHRFHPTTRRRLLD